MNNSVCFIGAGYIGGSTGPVMAMKNPDKTFYICDIDQQRIDAWNSENLPIYEPGLDEIVKQIRGKNLFFTVDIQTAIEKSDVIFIGVNTPTKQYGNGAGSASNLEFWESAARTIAKYANSSKTIVEKSTLPVKTAKAIKDLLSCLCPQHTFHILSNPEFLAEGTAVRDLLDPDRVLIGGNAEDAQQIDAVAHLYEAWVPKEKIIKTGLWSSELSKLASNAMLAQRVSSINALACACEEFDADISEVSKILGMDKRIGDKFLKAGPGFGGSCFKKDILSLIYLCRSKGLDEVASYWESVISMNEYQQERIVLRILEKSFNTLTNKKICIFGYAFKADTSDTRETPAKAIVGHLKHEHAKCITIYDPKANEHAKNEVEDSACYISDDPYEAAYDADILIICTDWNEFKTYDWKKIYGLMSNQRLMFDARNFLDHDKLKSIGFDVMTVGKK